MSLWVQVGQPQTILPHCSFFQMPNSSIEPQVTVDKLLEIVAMFMKDEAERSKCKVIFLGGGGRVFICMWYDSDSGNILALSR
jgi:hypothetical protein